MIFCLTEIRMFYEYFYFKKHTENRKVNICLGSNFTISQ